MITAAAQPRSFAFGITVAAVMGWVLLAVCFVLAPAGAYVGSDVGYYLPLADGLAHGRVPLLDVPVHYTPLGILIMGLPALFSSTPSYESHVVVQIVVILLGALGIAHLARSLNARGASAALASAYYAFSGLYFEGSTALEPFVALFIVWALVLAFRQPFVRRDALRWVCVGAVASFAVLCKQQGVFLVIGVLMVITLSVPSNERLKRLALTCVGGAGGIALLLALVFSSKLGTAATIANLTWSGRTYSGADLMAGIALVVTLLVIKASPFAIGVPLTFRREMVGFALAAAVACAPAVLKPYPHYLTLALPFTAPLAAMVFEGLASSERWHRAKRGLLAVLVGFLLFQVTRLALRYRSPEANLAQLRERGATLHAAVGSRPVLQLTSPALVYFADLTPSALGFAGYMFGGYFKLSEVESTLLPGAEVIIAEEDATGFEFNDGTFLFAKLPDLGFCKQPAPVPRLAYWKRCPTPESP